MYSAKEIKRQEQRIKEYEQDPERDSSDVAKQASGLAHGHQVALERRMCLPAGRGSLRVPDRAAGRTESPQSVLERTDGLHGAPIGVGRAIVYRFECAAYKSSSRVAGDREVRRR